MKKRIWIIMFIIILIIIAIILAFVKKEERINEFAVDEYKYYIENYASDKSVEPIDSSRKAIKEAEKIWLDKYGDSVRFKRPYVVGFDENERVWFVSGSLNYHIMAGGVPYILIREDGKVLAVWHDK